jgi:hypothetical protein
MPLNKMPFGLIDYNIRFFASNSIQSVHAEKHYAPINVKPQRGWGIYGGFYFLCKFSIKSPTMGLEI